MISDRLDWGIEIGAYLPFLAILFSFVLIYEAFRRKTSSPLFWGIFLLVVGGFYTLRNAGVILYLYPDEYWPLFPIAIGLGLVSKFVFRPSEWGVLIPAAILLMVGVTGILNQLGFWYGDLDSIWNIFWPVLIISIGLIILIRSFTQQKKEDNQEISS
jgi:peptidoglycan/LPS O-acetylase OafA/YrhL